MCLGYHIHEFPISQDLNCSSSGAHLDPYGATESPPCDPSRPESCQVGDLAGKDGKMNGPSYTAKCVLLPSNMKHSNG